MCGITGYFGPGSDVGASGFRKNLQRLRHRGPDGEGYVGGVNWALGQTRLEIVGGAHAGVQPVRSQREAFVFNGEIHNYRELAAELHSYGQACDGNSDTSVAFAALRFWGREAVGRFRGFWAFLYVDEAAAEVWCCRDRFGQKPLLYSRTPDGIRFASEAHALGIRLEPEPAAVLHFLREAQYPPAPATMFVGVFQVCPGSILTVSLKDLSSRAWKYHQPSASETTPDTFEDAVSGFAERLTRSLRLRMRADVPVGLLLSAGKDSGTLHTLLAGHSEVAAFTFSHPGAQDEAAQVKLWYDGQREIHYARLSEDVPARVEAIHDTLDAPVLSASLLALDALYASAKRAGVPVVLSGQGADELLGGYHYYGGLQFGHWAGWRARAYSVGGVREIWGALRDRRAASAVLAGVSPAADAYLPARAPLSLGSLDAVTERRISDLSGEQLQSMLWYEDRISMRHSVETRCPFLDVDLVDYCLAQPGEYFVMGRTRKRLLNAAFGQTWPPALRLEGTKRGLPAGEGDLLHRYSAFAREGITYACGHLAIPRPAHPRANESLGGARESKALWRLSMVGHWLRSLQRNPPLVY